MKVIFGLSLLVATAFVRAEDAPKPFPERPTTADVEPSAEQKTSIAKFVEQLGDADFQKRVGAEGELRKLGRVTLKQLRAAETGSDDIQIRATAVKLIREMQTEVWEGYYFYSLDDFDTAVANKTNRVRFWLTVARKDDGSFTAEADEQAENLGRSTMEGKVNRDSGEFSFNKTYANQAAAWRYEGKWNAEKQRIDGTYGPNSGGFVLFPRKLSEDEHKRYDDTMVRPVLEINVDDGDDF
jgi:hypothetical protein